MKIEQTTDILFFDAILSSCTWRAVVHPIIAARPFLDLDGTDGHATRRLME